MIYRSKFRTSNSSYLRYKILLDMYRNNGETACQMCHADMDIEEFEFCDICPHCRDGE